MKDDSHAHRVGLKGNRGQQNQGTKLACNLHCAMKEDEDASTQ